MRIGIRPAARFRTKPARDDHWLLGGGSGAQSIAGAFDEPVDRRLGEIHSLCECAHAQIPCESNHNGVALAAQVMLLALAGYVLRNRPGVAAVEMHLIAAAAKRS